jgi:cellulose biosynthesis protein BcsQ
MSVAIFGGAGGDGKTTILQLLAQYDARLNKTPLLIDANPDQNLADFFGLSAAQKNDIPAILTIGMIFVTHWKAKTPIIQIRIILLTHPLLPLIQNYGI